MADVPSPWLRLLPSARRVALEVLLHGPLARSELVDRLGLSAASLTRLTKSLMDAGLLLEVDAVDPPRDGRPLQPLDIDAKRQRFIGVKLAGHRAYGVLTDLRADIIECASIEITDHEPKAVTAELSALVDRFEEGSVDVAGIGIGLGGVVRDFTWIEQAVFLNWQGLDLGTMVHDAIGRPVSAANDVHALLEAEHWFGEGRDVENFAVLTIGAGVGGGLVIHDRLVGGPDSGLGLLGHFPIDPLGPACPEGHRGCADALLTVHAIVTQAALALGRSITYDEVLDLAEAGDPIADQIVGQAGHAFGTLIAAVANIAQPERIILTGEGIRLAKVARRRMEAAIAAARHAEATPLDLRLINDDPTMWARGAAAVAIQRTVLASSPPGPATQ